MRQTTGLTLTPAEIAGVFALYYNCQVIVTNKRYINGGFIGTLKGISYENPLVLHPEHSDGYENQEDCKLLLIPLELITDENAVVIAKICDPSGNLKGMSVNELIQWGRWRVNTALKDKNFPHYLYQYLILKEYAVPLWFGMNHSLNDRDAITLGIATDKTQTTIK